MKWLTVTVTLQFIGAFIALVAGFVYDVAIGFVVLGSLMFVTGLALERDAETRDGE